MGRPVSRRRTKEKRSERLWVIVTPSEARQIQAAAELHLRSPSSYMRMVVLNRIRKPDAKRERA